MDENTGNVDAESTVEKNNPQEKDNLLRDAAVIGTVVLNTVLGTGNVNAQENNALTPNELGENKVEHVVQNDTRQEVDENTAPVDVFYEASAHVRYGQEESNRIQREGENEFEAYLDKLPDNGEEVIVHEHIEPPAEDEIENLPTPQETFNIVSRNGLNDKEISYARQHILSGEIDIATLTPEQSIQIANSFTPEELKTLGEEKQQALADIYINAYNRGENPELLAEALQGPLGKRYMAEQGGISLDINMAEQLLASNAVNLDNIGMNRTSFLARALDDTFRKLDNEATHNYDRDNRLRDNNALSAIAYRYAQDKEIMGQMQESSKLGRYALDVALRDKGGEGLSQSDQTVIANVMQDVINNQDNQTAIGNYNLVCQRLCDYTPEAYCAYDTARQSGNMRIFNQYEQTTRGQTRDFLMGQIQNVHNNIDPSSNLASSESMLQRYQLEACQSEKYRAIEDLSIAMQLCKNSRQNNNFNNLTRDYMSIRGYYDRDNIKTNYSQRQMDFAMYIKYKEKGKLSPEEQRDLAQIEQRYGSDFLKRSYNYVSAIHDGNLGKARKARDELMAKDHIKVPAVGSDGKVCSVTGMLRNLFVSANNYQKLDYQWNNMIDKKSEEQIKSESRSIASMATARSAGASKSAPINGKQAAAMLSSRNQGGR